MLRRDREDFWLGGSRLRPGPIIYGRQTKKFAVVYEKDHEKTLPHLMNNLLNIVKSNGTYTDKCL